MSQITLSYGSGPTSKTFDVLSVKGFDDADDVEFVNAFVNRSDDGTYFEHVEGTFHRRIVVDFGAVDLKADRVFFVQFFLATNTKTLTYGSESSLAVVVPNLARVMNEWFEGSSLAKRYVVEFIEKSPRSGNPAIWS